MPVSSRSLSLLPTIENLGRLTKSLAILDAIIEPEWEYRYFSFNSKWDTDEQMASLRNGQGDEWFCVFSKVGAFLKGFDHESMMSPWNANPRAVWKGILDQVPDAFKPYVAEPAFSMDNTTFCVWRGMNDNVWHTGRIDYPEGDDPDGSERLLYVLEGRPEDYKEWADSYYECAVDLDAVKAIYVHTPLSPELVSKLNPDRDMKSLRADIEQIGYRVSAI